MPDKKDKRVKITVVEDDEVTTSKDALKETETANTEKNKIDELVSETPSEPKIIKTELKETSKSEESKEVSEPETDTETKQKETQKTNNSNTSSILEETEIQEKGEKIPFWILFLAFLIGLSLGAGLIGGIFFYKSRVDKIPLLGPTPTPEIPFDTSVPISSTTPEASPTSQEKSDLSKVSIQILNGSGISGEAGRVDALLKKAGFVKTTVGNAGTYNFTKTVISVKKDTPTDVYSAIEKALSGYVLEKKVDLKDSSSYAVVITVGKDKSSN